MSASTRAERKRARRGPIVALLLGVMAVAGAAAQEPLAAPSGRVLLEVSGRITTTNARGAARLDRGQLEALGMVTVRTITPWTTGEVEFEGPLVSALLDRVGATGGRIRASAVNDYVVEIPVDELRTYRVILAMKRDGEVMGLRDRGPLWVIYPWSDHPHLRDEVHHSRSIWQLREIVVE